MQTVRSGLGGDPIRSRFAVEMVIDRDSDDTQNDEEGCQDTESLVSRHRLWTSSLADSKVAILYRDRRK